MKPKQKLTSIFIACLICIVMNAQENQFNPVEVLTLGTFHFNFPNLDVNKTLESDQIDALDHKYQKEIKSIVEKVEKFKPTLIVVERPPKYQKQLDSIYSLYLQDKYQLRRHEEEQIGFRLAKKLGLDKLHCVDEWGDFDTQLDKIVKGVDTLEYRKFEDFNRNNNDYTKINDAEQVFRTKGILEELKVLNDPDNIKSSLAPYLLGAFKYESEPGDFIGVRFETGRWFSRNLKILRNIQRIETKPTDRILVIYGAGHLGLLNIFFDASPEYKLIGANKYLN